MNLKTIIRSARSGENPYFICARQPAQNKAMSYDARGLLWYLLSKPDDWQVMVPDLITDSCKRGKVYSLLRELEAHGYLIRGQQRMEGGRWSAGEYLIYETPCVENPHTGERDTDEPDAVKRTLQNKESTTRRVLQKEEKKDSALGAGSEPKPRERNPLFDAVAAGHGLDDVGAEGGRIAMIANWLAGTYEGKGARRVGKISAPATVEHIQQFFKDWSIDCPNVNPPMDFVKFVEHWRIWASRRRESANRPTSSYFKPLNSKTIHDEVTDHVGS